MSLEEQFVAKYRGVKYVLPDGTDLDALQQGLANHVQQEVALAHGIEKNTVEVRVLVDIEDVNGDFWRGERVIKIEMKKQSSNIKQTERKP